MPTPTKGPRLGGSPAHERMLLANLAKALFEHGSITTTEAKARRLRPYAERLITKAKRGDLHARRQVAAVIRNKTKPDPDAPGDAKTIVHRLFTEIGPGYEGRQGGYTRITKIGPRKGDNAPMAVIELVEAATVAQQAVGEAEAATRRSARDRAPEPAPATASVRAVLRSVAIAARARVVGVATSSSSTSSMIAIGAASPLRGPTFTIRV